MAGEFYRIELTRVGKDSVEADLTYCTEAGGDIFYVPLFERKVPAFTEFEAVGIMHDALKEMHVFFMHKITESLSR